MTTSKMLAALIGPTLVAMAIGMLLHISALPAFIEGSSRDPAVILLSGAITFVAGLAMVRFHNVWKGWPTVVTIVGWLAVLGGLVRILFPLQLAAIAARVAHHSSLLVVGFIVWLAVGGFLAFKGYSRS